jgi:hypothetical protein
MRLCRSIGTELLAVEYDDKDMCIAKLAKSNISLYTLNYFGGSLGYHQYLIQIYTIGKANTFVMKNFCPPDF